MTTATRRCDLTDLLETDCAHCKRKDDPAWPAKYQGACALCERGVEVGQLIRWSQDGGAVEHAHHMT